MMTIPKVELTAEEQQLFDSLEWNTEEFNRKDHVERRQLLENQYKLTLSLIDRDAIPRVRLSFFVDLQMNIGKRGKSKKDIFEGNGCVGDDIFRDQNFGRFLWYFIHGPTLPQSTIQGFSKIKDDDRDDIAKFVRNEVRIRNLDYKAPDEFIKLVLEVGRPELAETVRTAAKAA